MLVLCVCVCVFVCVCILVGTLCRTCDYCTVSPDTNSQWVACHLENRPQHSGSAGGGERERERERED